MLWRHVCAMLRLVVTSALAQPLMSSRRAVSLFAWASALPAPQAAVAALQPATVMLPLQPTAGGIFSAGIFIDGEIFRVIIDTGSPYLVVPLDDCALQPPRLSYYGCATPGQFRQSGAPSTSEQYGVLPGRVEWLQGDVAFGETETALDPGGSISMRVRFEGTRAGGNVIFGGGDRNVMGQSGGALFGLIRQVNTGPSSTIPAADLRPTALAQLGFTSFCLDAGSRMLTLSSKPLIRPKKEADALPLVDPRMFGDGVEHICCHAVGNEVQIDGAAYRSRRPILCVFDSGLTGCVLSQSLVDEFGLSSRVTKGTNSAARRGLQSLKLAISTERGQHVLLGSSEAESPLFYAQAIPLNWFVDATNGPHVVALGQCVLGRGSLTVDGPERRAVWRVTP